MIILRQLANSDAAGSDYFLQIKLLKFDYNARFEEMNMYLQDICSSII